MNPRIYPIARDPFASRAFFPVFSEDDLTGPEGVERLFAVRSEEEVKGVALNAAKAAPLLANDLLASPRMQAAFGAGIGGFDQALRYLLDGE